MALSVYEDLIVNQSLNQESVDNFLISYLQWMKQDKFYMCTDDNAITHLETELSIEGLNLKNPEKTFKKT